MKSHWRNLIFLIFAGCSFVSSTDGQIRRELPLAKAGTVEIVNRYGRVEVIAVPADDDGKFQGVLACEGKTRLAESEVVVDTMPGSIRIEVRPADRSNRVDISLSVPERSKIKVETADGEVRFSGDIESATVTTETGTIAANIPVENVRYEMLWTQSRPRFLSDFDLEKVKERSGGKFSIKGRFEGEAASAKAGASEGSDVAARANGKVKEDGSSGIELRLTTERGIILINVPPNEVMNDLRERPLTEAARAIIRSGDTLLTNAIRRASPKYFGEYARTLPPLKREPGMKTVTGASTVKRKGAITASVRVTDLQNRAIGGLGRDDFEVSESGEPREILSLRPATAPVNLVLLVDVSGSVENYVNFIRKAARAFVETVGARDRVSIVIFNEDVKTLAAFSSDKSRLSRSLDTFDAGGGTAYYDAIAYTLTEVLRPLRGERTAIVVLSDGDDNRSFLPFDALAGSIEESGSLIYPLYVPTSLIAAAANSSDPNEVVDPLRSRYLSNDITSKADAEGRRLAEISGGVYYPITQLAQIQTAYDDIVVQLRTAYDITFRSDLTSEDGRPSPRLKVRSTRPNTFVQIRNIVPDPE